MRFQLVLNFHGQHLKEIDFPTVNAVDGFYGDSLLTKRGAHWSERTKPQNNGKGIYDSLKRIGAGSIM